VSETPVTKLPAPARFYCPPHGPTNAVQQLGGQVYCLACLHIMARLHLHSVERIPERA
jgi:hypothetical protein